MLPKLNGYAKSFDEASYMSFLIKDDELLKSEIKSVIVSKKVSIVDLCIIINI